MQKPGSGFGPSRWVIACLALLCLLLLGLDGWTTWQSHERRLQDAERAASNLAQVVARQVDDSVTAVDLALAYVVRRVEGDLDRDDYFADLGEALAARAGALPQVAELFVFDESGGWVANSLRMMPKDANNMARDYFIHHRDHAGPESYIGPPIRSRINGEWVMTVSRRISRPDGAFAGVALATIPLSYLRDFYNGLDIGRDGIIAIMRDNGTLLLRHPVVESEVDLNASGSALHRAYLAQPAHGVMRERSPIDGVERIYAYHHSGRYPVVMLAALSYDTLFAPWTRDALIHAGVLVALALLAAAGGLGYLALQRRARLLGERLLGSRQRLGHLADKLPLLALRVDGEHRLRFCNAACRAWLGIAPGPLAPRPLAAATGAALHEQWRPMLDRALAGEQAEFDCEAMLHGRAHSLRMLFMPDRAHDGAIRGVVVLGSDVTALRAGERRIRAIADNTPALLAFVDADQRISYSNSHGDAAPGIDATRMVGRTVQEVYGGAVYSVLASHVDAALAGQRAEFEYSVDQGGERRVLRNSYLPERDGAGQVIGFYLLSEDVTAFKEAEQKVARLARFDALTGLPNRSHLCERLDEALLRSDRSGRALALVRLDIDCFRDINDSLGHQGGDTVLKEFAARLVRSCRATDMAARLGGDEFVVLMEALTEPEESRLVVAKILDAMRQPFEVAGQSHTLTVTAATALSHGETSNPNRLLKQAGVALRQAKAAAHCMRAEVVG